jgi:hypothetical protein
LRIKASIGTFVAVLALAGVAAGGAYAAGGGKLVEGLQLSERGTPVPSGAAVLNENFIVDGQCLQAATAKVLDNGDPVDVLQVEPLTYNQCEGGGALSGQLRYVALSETGMALAVAQPALVLNAPGPCVYEVSLLQGQFPIGVETAAYVVGEATGYLNAAASTAKCAHTIHTEFTVGEFGADGFLLNTELTSSIVLHQGVASYARPAKRCKGLLARVVDLAEEQEPGSGALIGRRGCHETPPEAP